MCPSSSGGVNRVSLPPAFPHGLYQPEKTARFSLDTLLLAAFAARACEKSTSALTVAELGCGCGAALLGLALRCQHITGYGFERIEALFEAARSNAASLGLGQRLRFFHCDIAHCTDCVSGPLDIVMANPPYGLTGQGRPSAHTTREAALRDTEALPVFCKAAASLLRHHGHFFCIFEAGALPRLCAELGTANLGVRRIVPVRTRRHMPALRLLVEARKSASHDLRLFAPLTLHKARKRKQRDNDTPSWTAQTLAFCHWLAAERQTDYLEGLSSSQESSSSTLYPRTTR